MKNNEAILIEDKIQALEDYKNKKIGYDFKEKIKSLTKQGSYDYELRKAYNYMINYIETMEKYAGRPHYKEFMEKLKSFSSPLAFYNRIKNADNELFEDLHYQSDETLQQEELEELMKAWGTEFSNENIEFQENGTEFSDEDMEL